MRFHLLIFIQMLETSLRLKSYRGLLIFWTLCVSLLLSFFILNFHNPNKFFLWRSKPSGKVPKSVRKDFPWWLPSGITRQETNVRESTPSLMKNHQGPFPDGYCRQKRVSLSFFPFPPGKIFPVSCIPVREGSNFPCRLQYRKRRFIFPFQ